MKITIETENKKTKINPFRILLIYILCMLLIGGIVGLIVFFTIK